MFLELGLSPPPKAPQSGGANLPPTPGPSAEAMLEIAVVAKSNPIRAAVLDPLIETYLEEVKETLSPRTANNYRHQIQPFRAWWAEVGPGLDHILTEQAAGGWPGWVRKHYTTTKGKPPAPATVRSGAIRVRQFFRWLFRTGRLPVDISHWSPLPTKQPHGRRFLDRAQCQALFDAVPDGPLRFRDRAMLAFLLDTGARRFEAAAALWADLHTDERGGWCRLRLTKGDAEGETGGRLVAFGPETARAIHYHRQFLHITGREGDDPRLLGMTNTAIKDRLDKLAQRVGWAIGAHDCRRTFADHWWERNRAHEHAMILLKLQMGHTVGDDITLTHYVDLRNENRLIEMIREVYVGPCEGLRVLPI
jgi:integrase